MTIQQLLKTAPATTVLLVCFIGLYVLQVLSGVDANHPSTEALLKWGANALPYTMGYEPWRLVSSAFLHIGFMHLLFNGFAMYFFGQIAEPMFGSTKFLALFILSAIGGNLLNNHITWQGILDATAQPGLSAGASGGIMGIGAGLLIAALFKISVNNMVLNLKSLVFIMAINLVYGFAVPGIDNAGHIGGALTGLVIALAIGIAHRQRLITTPAIPPNNYQMDYKSNQSSNQTSHQTDYNSYSSDSTVDSNSQTANINASIHNSSAPFTKPAIAKPTLLWQLLPWIVMLLVTIVFIWWWQDIHNQILQVLAAQ
ncbi:rhomboid family intramembrane serine protease [Psychrobacter urativorans]|uniref:rhomboid family intramembrane serine protease n=1 Tax=Psychrobacter urativorans TaxID=45610 RepID=UPI00191AE9A2|nr:rhomboid family intramembrane serine protease [Psychrobacter urativorans]